MTHECTYETIITIKIINICITHKSFLVLFCNSFCLPSPTPPLSPGNLWSIHCPSALKAHAPGFWYCFPLPAIISQFTLSVQGSKRGVLSFVHIWRANGSLPNISLSQKSEADLLLLSKEFLSEPPILSLPSETQCWPEEMGIPVILDWNIEWTLP